MKLSRMTKYCLILLSLTIQPAVSSTDNKPLISPEMTGKVALLPFGNLTETDIKDRFIVDQVQLALEKLNIEFVSTDDIRPVLRKHRIRSRGKISRHDALILKDELDVNLILIGSIDLILDVEIPEFSFSMRLLSPDDVIVRSAVSVSASGQDYTKLFSIGTVEECDRLIELVATDAVNQLFERLLIPPTINSVLNQRWAVVPFDNSSKNRMAGKIMANWLISYLVTNDYQIVEPGSIDRLFRPFGGSTVGGIDLKRANLVNDSLDVTYIITGEIDIFNPAIGNLANSTPELTFGVRVSECQQGMVVASYECATDGDQVETVFGMGRVHSIGTLAPRIFKNMQQYLEKKLVKYGAMSE